MKKEMMKKDMDMVLTEDILLVATDYLYGRFDDVVDNPASLISELSDEGMDIPYREAVFTILYCGRWEHDDWLDEVCFVFPHTQECMREYQTVKENFGKEVEFIHGKHGEFDSYYVIEFKKQS